MGEGTIFIVSEPDRGLREALQRDSNGGAAWQRTTHLALPL